MKPFNLEEALSGKPVKLRNGNKAFIKYVHTEDEIKLFNIRFPLGGYAIERDGTSGKLYCYPYFWKIDGRFSDYDEGFSVFDIVEMWEDPKPKRYVNGIEVSEPVTFNTVIFGQAYWYPLLDSENLVERDILYDDDDRDKKLIRRGLVFKTQYEALKMAKALLNYKVEYKED
ncbi:hypothetical protein P9057_11695 [Gallibacterium anatis]|uniref:hypothetical protein n=1 Tax=Gallibacterium anatis TaxID=750 RepID=UPI0005317BDD|nr:hypothetical protein [Gallibacterium anatis]KGQ27273.1 hypothetical protein JP31_04695 [Gallibacterium anatis]KGQ28902.1 hypothetical protein JP27_02635 [Gallibacterium anatis]WIM83070.1 hypothetical protein QP019_05325 [Gallibacterium anatis]